MTPDFSPVDEELLTKRLKRVAPWFSVTKVDDHVTRIEEPWVDDLLRANSWHIQGLEHDLFIDSGLGVASLRQELPGLFLNSPALVITHAHLDHMGSAHEFEHRWAHTLEPISEPAGTSILGSELAAQLGLDISLPGLLVNAWPKSSKSARYTLQTTSATRALNDGDKIDLGNLELEVLHLPGHTPGSICLLETSSQTLFSGDVIYDDVLLDNLRESCREDYASSLLRLREMPISMVRPGHGSSFNGRRLNELIDAYLRTFL